MRLAKDKVFARPILKSIREDFTTTFAGRFDAPDNRRSEIGIRYKYSCTSSTFNQLLNQNKIGIYLHMYAGKNMFRRCIEISSVSEDCLYFKKDELFNSCDLTIIICAKEDLVIDGHSELVDKDDAYYNVEKGQIIGYVPTVELELDLSKNTLNDFVQVTHTDDSNKYNKISFENDTRIIYYLSVAEYKAYASLYSNNNIGKTLSYIIHQSIYNRLFLELYYRNKNDMAENDVVDKCINILKDKFNLLGTGKEINQVEPEEFYKYSFEMANLSFVEMSEIIKESDEI